MRRIGLLGALALAGCPHPPVARPYAPPTAEQLLARLDAQLSTTATLRSSAKVDFAAGKGERVKLKISFLARRPASLRMEAEAALAGPVASLASDGASFQFLDVRDNRFLAGEASACGVARLIRLALAPGDVVALLLGAAPRPPEIASMEVGWDGSHGGREVLTLVLPSGEVETLRFDAVDRRWDLLAAELRDKGGELVWKIDHGDFAEAGAGLRLPAASDVEQPGKSVGARLRFKSREPGAEVPESVFHLEPPAGIPVERVDGAGC